MRSYNGLTLHCVDENFDTHNYTLEVEPFAGKHDGLAIQKALDFALPRWGLKKEFCTKLLRDGASNAVRAATLLDVPHMSCVNHSLQLVVGGLLFARPKRASKRTNQPPEVSAVAHTLSHTPPGIVDPLHLPSAQDTLRDCTNPEAAAEQYEEAMEALQDEACDEIETFLTDSASQHQRERLKEIRDIMQQFRKIAVYFHTSAKAKHRLNEIQKAADVVIPLETSIDCPTRWSSSWPMLDRLIKLEQHIDRLFAFLEETEGKNVFGRTVSVRRPEPSAWFSAKCLHRLLAPFAAVTVLLGGEGYPTIVAVAPCLRSLERRLADETIFYSLVAKAGRHSFVPAVCAMVHQARYTLLDLLRTRFSTVTSDLLWLSLLEPRCAKQIAKMTQFTETEFNEAKKTLLLAMIDADDYAPVTPTREVQPIALSQTPTPQKEARDVYRDVYGDNDEDSPGWDFSPTSHAEDHSRAKCERQLGAYLDLITTKGEITNKTDPFAWWRAHRNVFPLLARLARKWLGCVATSVPSERAFSTGGNVVSAKRCSLKPDLVRDLVFVAQNFKKELL